MTDTGSQSRSTRVVLIRHGESTWNDLSLVQGHDDQARLTVEGRAQVTASMRGLLDTPFDALLSSDLTRATETAEILAAGLGLTVTTTPLLRERSYGEYEGRALAELPSFLSGIRDGWVIDATARPAGGESLNELYERCAEQVHAWHDGPFRRVLAVTHGGTIRALRAYGAGSGMLNLEWDRVGNCSVWPLDFAAR